MAERCRTLAECLQERKKTTLNSLGRCASLDKQVALYKQMMSAIADLNGLCAVPHMLEQLLWQGRSLRRIVGLLTGAMKYSPMFSSEQKQICIL